MVQRLCTVCVIALLLLASGTSGHAGDRDTEDLLDQAIAGEHRSQTNKARDQYRHPKETLVFFGLQPDMTVVEIWPGGGWYTEILAPVLRAHGKLHVARFALKAKDTPDFRKEMDAGYGALLAGNSDIYGKVVSTELEAPEFANIAPAGSADLVLTFRNVHNWTKAGNDLATFKAFHAALKPGGILGVVEHRAKPGTPLPEMIRTGYMTEAYVIELAEKAGFKLASKSEINANAKDTKDHPKGVWTLPPTLRLGDTGRDKYLAIGESDRMTLKFVKPE